MARITVCLYWMMTCDTHKLIGLWYFEISNWCSSPVAIQHKNPGILQFKPCFLYKMWNTASPGVSRFKNWKSYIIKLITVVLRHCRLCMRQIWYVLHNISKLSRTFPKCNVMNEWYFLLSFNKSPPRADNPLRPFSTSHFLVDLTGTLRMNAHF